MWKKYLNGNNRINNYNGIIVYIYKSPDVNADIFKYTEVSNSKTNTTKARMILCDNEYEVLPRECEVEYVKNWTLNYNLLQHSRISN